MVTQSPSLARIESGWIASLPCSPIETFFDFSCARTAGRRSRRVYICPSGSWSPKPFSVMSTSMETTSKCRTGAPVGQTPPAPPPPVAAPATAATPARTSAAAPTRTRSPPPKRRRRLLARSAMGNATASARAASRASARGSGTESTTPGSRIWRRTWAASATPTAAPAAIAVARTGSCWFRARRAPRKGQPEREREADQDVTDGGERRRWPRRERQAGGLMHERQPDAGADRRKPGCHAGWDSGAHLRRPPFASSGHARQLTFRQLGTRGREKSPLLFRSPGRGRPAADRCRR